MFSDTLISPKADHDIRKRLANYKKRPETPNFRDLLRQRCRERVKARREVLFDQLRTFQNEENIRFAISHFIERDLKEIHISCHSIVKNESMDVAENEPLSQLAVSDKEKWILEEYDRMIENIDAQLEMAELVACPMCLRGELCSDVSRELVTCSLCPLQLPYTMPLAELEVLILQAVDSHGLHCSLPPQFTVCPDTYVNSLILLCSTCGHVRHIV